MSVFSMEMSAPQESDPKKFVVHEKYKRVLSEKGGGVFALSQRGALATTTATANRTSKKQ